MLTRFAAPLIKILILCSLSIFLTQAYNPTLQKSYFSITPNRPFSYEFSQTRNGTIAHYFDSSSFSRYILFDIASGDAKPILEKTFTACQLVPPYVQEVASPMFQHLHHHVATDNLVYFCALNSSLLFITQADHTVQNAIPLNLNGTWQIAKLSTDGMNVNILGVDFFFRAAPKSSILVKVDMQTKQVASQILFNQNLTTAEHVVAYTTGNKASYIATSTWNNNNNYTIKIYSIIMIGNTYQMTPVVNFTSSAKTITKLVTIGKYIVVNVDTTLYLLEASATMARQYSIQTKSTAGISYPAFICSNDGLSLYFHTDTLAVYQYTAISFTNFGTFKDFQIALANKTSNDLMFSYDTAGVFFKIMDFQTGKNIRTAISTYTDLILTTTTYTVVQNNNFYLFNLKTDDLVMQFNITSGKYYYNKNQHIVTFLSSSCQVTHLDLVSGKIWTTLKFSSSDICSSYVSYARMTEKGNPELVIPGPKSYMIISETYGQIKFNTSDPTHDTEGLNVNFDDLSFYYYTANQYTTQINASYYTFNAQSQQFQLNSSRLLNGSPVSRNGFFPMNQNYTVALSDVLFTLINGISAPSAIYPGFTFNLATGFEDKLGTLYVLFSYVSSDSIYLEGKKPILYGNDGKYASIPGKRDTTVSGQAVGSKSLAVFDLIYSSVGLVRFYNADSQESKAFISI